MIITLTWSCCCFFCVTWAQFMAVLYGFTARCLFGVVFLQKRSKAGDGVQSRLTKLSCTDERRTDSPLKPQFFRATQVSHLFASSWIL